MKLLFVFGDAAYVLTHRLSLIQVLEAKGYDITVACPQSPTADKLKAMGLKISTLKYFDRGGLNPFRELLAIHELFKVISTYSPDIVHAVAMKGILDSLVAIACIRRLVPPKFIGTLGGLGYLFISEKWLVKQIRKAVILAFKVLFHGTQGHLILQNQQDDQCLQDLGLDLGTRKHRIRGSGVCPKTYPFVPEPLVSDLGSQIVYVGRLLKDKGLEELMAAIRILKAKNIPGQFLIYGSPDPRNPASIPCSVLESWEHEGLITYKGPTDEPSKVYQQSHGVVLPSYREGLPKSLLEAALTGRALVATDVPGCRDVVIDQETGFLVPLFDIKALADALEKILTNPDLRQSMGRTGHTYVMQTFSDPIIHQQHHDLYQRL